MRRSTRVQLELPVRVRSLDPGFAFEERCKTLLLNAQGCGFQCSRQLPVGIAILLTVEDRQATATVLNATSLGENSGAWVVGAKLHQSGNFWGIPTPPPDWETGPTRAATPPSGAVDQYITDRVTAEIQRQSEQAMSMLRSEVERLVAARESDFLSRVVEQSSVTAVEMVQRLAEQETERIQHTFETLSAQFRRDLEQHTERQMAVAEQRLREVHAQMSESSQARLDAVQAKIMEKMQSDAKRLSESAIEQWHAAFEQTLQMLPELVRENLQQRAAATTLARH